MRDSLACLARVACTEETERVLSADLEEAAYDAWARARRDIYEEWQRGADPANLQPDIRPLFRCGGPAQDQPGRYPLGEVDRLADSLMAVEADTFP